MLHRGLCFLARGVWHHNILPPVQWQRKTVHRAPGRRWVSVVVVILSSRPWWPTKIKLSKEVFMVNSLTYKKKFHLGDYTSTHDPPSWYCCSQRENHPTSNGAHRVLHKYRTSRVAAIWMRGQPTEWRHGLEQRGKEFSFRQLLDKFWPWRLTKSHKTSTPWSYLIRHKNFPTKWRSILTIEELLYSNPTGYWVLRQDLRKTYASKDKHIVCM